MPCEDWDPDHYSDRPMASIRVRAAEIEIEVETSNAGAILRWAAGGEVSLRLHPDVGYRIHRGPDIVVLELAGLEALVPAGSGGPATTVQHPAA